MAGYRFDATQVTLAHTQEDFICRIFVEGRKGSEVTCGRLRRVEESESMSRWLDDRGALQALPLIM